MKSMMFFSYNLHTLILARFAIISRTGPGTEQVLNKYLSVGRKGREGRGGRGETRGKEGKGREGKEREEEKKKREGGLLKRPPKKGRPTVLCLMGWTTLATWDQRISLSL